MGYGRYAPLEFGIVMAIEIERKFLVKDDTWRRNVRRSVHIRQGYFARTPLMRARIRIFDYQGFIALKSEPGVMTRYEFEYEIPKHEAEEMICRFSIEPIVSKTRHELQHAGLTWEVDVFEGANLGLVVAELELGDEAQVFEKPAWVGKEVITDRRYGNSNLARYPFVTWGADGLVPGLSDNM